MGGADVLGGRVGRRRGAGIRRSLAMRWFPLAVLALSVISATLVVAVATQPEPVRARHPRPRHKPEEWRAAGVL